LIHHKTITKGMIPHLFELNQSISRIICPEQQIKLSLVLFGEKWLEKVRDGPKSEGLVMDQNAAITLYLIVIQLVVRKSDGVRE
jgi:hypothetical protein